MCTLIWILMHLGVEMCLERALLQYWRQQQQDWVSLGNRPAKWPQLGRLLQQ